MIKQATICSLALLLIACRKDKPASNSNTQAIITTSNSVFICNEGNFQFGNAKLSIYDPESNTVQEDVFQTTNKRPLGDVFQSMNIFNGKGYLVVNNSSKIEVINPRTFVVQATITGLSSPRYFLAISNSKAYVTDYAANKINILDLSNNTLSGSITCPGWTEQLLLTYGKAFVSTQTNNKIYVINTLTDVLTDSITIGYSSNAIKEDKNGKLWVLCNGSKTKGIAASLHKINPITNAVEQTFQFPSLNDYPWRLAMNGANDTLYYLNKNVYRMSIEDKTLPTTAFISTQQQIFYGLGIDPREGTIYLADAVDYVQRGIVYRYQPNGKPIGSFLAGIIPSGFYFN